MNSVVLPLNDLFSYHPKHKLIVVWQAKAACAIVNKMFFEEEGLLEIALEYSSWIHNYRMNSYEFEHDSVRREGLSDPDSRFIQFVVNPYRRVVSSYVHAMICEYVGNNNKNICFSEFVDRLINGQIVPDVHHNMQTFNIEKNIEYVKMENHVSRLPEINAKYGTSYKIANSSHHAVRHDSVNHFVGDQVWEEIMNNLPQKYTHFYTDEIRKKVELLYGLDIKNFNYTWEEFENSTI